MRERRSAYRLLVKKLEGKRRLEKPRLRWEIILQWISKKSLVGREMD
jgi:hypothetical protein